MNRTTLLAELKESNINQLVANDMLQIRGGWGGSSKSGKKKSGKNSGKKSKKSKKGGYGGGYGCNCGCGW